MTHIASKQQPQYTNEQLQGLVGKHLLVGITRYNLEGQVALLEQFHGTISRVSLEDGVVIKLMNSDQERTIPPDFSCMEMARAGQYRLANTGEIVEDPDYIATWDVYPQGYKR